MVNPELNNEDYFSKFLTPQDLENSENDNENIQLEQPTPEEIKYISDGEYFSQFKTPSTYQGEPEPINEESTLSYLTRNVISNASRGVEILTGRYGDTEKFIKDTLTSYPMAGGLVGWGISSLVGPEHWENLVKGPPGRRQTLPTSEDLQEISEDLTGGYTKPHSEGEEHFQRYFKDVAAMFTKRGRNPIQRTLPQRIGYGAFNKIVTPVVANATKDIVEGLGFGEDKGNIAKLITWVPLTLAGNVNARQYAAQLMNRGRNGIPAHLQYNVPALLNRLDQVERQLLTSDPRTALARAQIPRIRNDIANGQTSGRSLMNMYDATNAAKRDAGLFQLNRADQRAARRAIDQVRDAVGDTIRDFQPQYPQAINDWQNGVMAFRTIHQSNAVSNYVQSLAKGPYAKLLSGPAAALFGIGSYGAYTAPTIVSGSVAAAIPAAHQTTKIIYRMSNNATLRDYYFRAFQNAGDQNKQAFIQNFSKFKTENERLEAMEEKAHAKKKNSKPAK
jgi:hypothetical protein